ncbi:diguanylate cyclase, partial [Candidatus Bathyarchaeota archaeon]|nr:diguanylate cyclase [Candidatus Bathyarchaeota archaeon]
MEEFEPSDEAKDDWLEKIALGRTYVTPTFEEDDYGTFLTAHAPIYDGTGKHAGFVGVDFDVGYFLKRERRLATHRPNFRGALLLIDIDSLRLVNDQHGHTYGDVVVAQTATAIRGALQPGSYAARLGGDEFMVLA